MEKREYHLTVPAEEQEVINHLARTDLVSDEIVRAIKVHMIFSKSMPKQVSIAIALHGLQNLIPKAKFMEQQIRGDQLYELYCMCNRIIRMIESDKELYARLRREMRK